MSIAVLIEHCWTLLIRRIYGRVKEYISRKLLEGNRKTILSRKKERGEKEKRNTENISMRSKTFTHINKKS